MTSPVLLDTCALLWSANGDISDDARKRLGDAARAGEAVFVSPISAWEIGLLAARGKFKAPKSSTRWFERVLRVPGIRLADMSPAILIASSILPGTPPRDPADRIVAATARELGLTVMTRDARLLDYARSGYLQVFEC